MMLLLGLEEIRRLADSGKIADAMRDALMAQSRGECDTPMPMHLAVPGESAEIHVKSSYRRGGPFFAVKAAASFPNNPARGRSASAGMMMLFSAETGGPRAFFADDGYLTDLRTAAAAAMVARELNRRDRALGLIGTGLQARLQARVHVEVTGVERVLVWGRNAERLERCVRDLRSELAGVEVAPVASPSELAQEARLIVTATSARSPLLKLDDLAPGTHISAVGSDTPGKQELDPEILRQCSLLLVDSLAQCERLGELQHAPEARARAVEIGAFCQMPAAVDPNGITLADFTGLGAEDLAIAEWCYTKAVMPNP